MDTDEDVHDTLTEIVRAELSQLATMDINEKNSLFLPDLHKPLTEEEALELENEILAEEGSKMCFFFCQKFIPHIIAPQGSTEMDKKIFCSSELKLKLNDMKKSKNSIQNYKIFT